MSAHLTFHRPQQAKRSGACFKQPPCGRVLSPTTHFGCYAVPYGVFCRDELPTAIINTRKIRKVNNNYSSLWPSRQNFALFGMFCKASRTQTPGFSEPVSRTLVAILPHLTPNFHFTHLVSFSPATTPFLYW